MKVLLNFIIKQGPTEFGWTFFNLGKHSFVVFLIGLAIFKYGEIRFGGKEARAEFKFHTWIAMLFSAGLGVGGSFLKSGLGYFNGSNCRCSSFHGGLEALQTASLISALPFTVVVLLLVVSFMKMLRDEILPISKKELKRHKKILEQIKKDQ